MGGRSEFPKSEKLRKMPGVRGRPPGQPKTGGGSRLGIPNKATAEVRDLAQVYTKEALEKLAEIMRKGVSEQARVTAAVALLDRAHGRPAQTIHATHKHEIDPEAVSDAQLATIAGSVVPQLDKIERDKMN